MKISFVIPCYCSEKTLGSVVNEIQKTMKKRDEYEYEIILVNDNSKDNTESIINSLVNENDNIIGISFARNFGQPNALMAGFRVANGDLIMTSDDDGQTPVGLFWEFLDKMNEGFDVVCAKYLRRPQKSLVRRLGTKLNESMMYHMINKPKEIGLSSFFLAKKFVIDEIVKYQNPYPYIAGLLLRTTRNIGNLEIQQRERISGKSGYNFSKLFKLWINGFTSFSLKPLRVGIALGFTSGIVGVLVAIYTLIRKIVIPTIQIGYTSQISITLILGGFILCVLGIIGEYIGRIYMCINGEPQYVIKSVFLNRKTDTNNSNRRK